jgi:uncharacterized protein with ParB-like and HNH nuclease domain
MTETYKTDLNQSSISSIINDLNTKSIDLDVEYQRDIVWGQDKQKLFIDSIVKGIAPNPIIMNVDSDGNKQCIDGKQRLTSLTNYYKNEFPILIDNQELYYNHNEFASLNRRQKKGIDNFKLFIVEYDELSYENQLDIFARIQYGAPLKHSETLLTNISNPHMTKVVSD